MPKQFSRKVGSELLPGYVIERELGRGGMGAVLLVRYAPTAKKYAVKTAIFSNNHTRRQFMEEIERWNALPLNPHWVRCFFVREIGTRVHVFAEYVAGGSLHSWIRNGLLQTTLEILNASTQLAFGLAALHAHGLVHQDVKPGNVLVDAQGMVKLADFGISGAYSQMAPQGAPRKGVATVEGMTLAYRSPEQSSNAGLDNRTDQWSWALTTLAMFNGGTTWRFGEAGREVLEDYRIHQDEALDSPLMPERIMTLLEKALEIDPRNRWSSMSEIAHELEGIYHSLFQSKLKPSCLANIAYAYESQQQAEAYCDDEESSFSEKTSMSVPSEAVTESMNAADSATNVALIPGTLPARDMLQLHHLDNLQVRLELTWERARTTIPFESLLAVYERKAATYLQFGDYRTAVGYYQRAAQLLRKVGESLAINLAFKIPEYHRLCAHLSAELGENDAALKSLREASLEMQQLRVRILYVDDEPTWRNQAQVLTMKFAATSGFILHNAGQSDLALDVLRTAIPPEIAEDLPATPALCQEAAEIRMLEGMILRDKGLMGEASTRYRSAAALIEVENEHISAARQSLFADILMWQGVTELKRKNLGKAYTLLQRSVRVRIFEVLPFDLTRGRIGLAQSQFYMGMLFDTLQYPAESRIWYNRAAQILDPLVHEHGFDIYGQLLVNALRGEVEAMRRLGSPLRENAFEAVPLLEHPRRGERRSDFRLATDFDDIVGSEHEDQHPSRRRKLLAAPERSADSSERSHTTGLSLALWTDDFFTQWNKLIHRDNRTPDIADDSRTLEPQNALFRSSHNDSITTQLNAPPTTSDDHAGSEVRQELPEDAETLIIIGTGTTSLLLCDKLIRNRLHHQRRIIVLEERFERPVFGQAWCDFHGIDIRVNDPVVAIDRQNSTVHTASGARIPFHSLVMATASEPAVPQMDGSPAFKNVFVFRSVNDAARLAQGIRPQMHVVVLGGHALGLQAVRTIDRLRQRIPGITIDMVEERPRLMPADLDDGAAAWLKECLEQREVTIHVGRKLAHVSHAADTEGTTLQFQNGRHLHADLIVIASSLSYQTNLAFATDLECAPGGGLIVDNTLHTSDKRIYALGTCASYRGKSYGPTEAVGEMVDVVLASLLGMPRCFTGASTSMTCRVLGIGVAILGEHTIHEDDNAVELVYTDATTYRKLVLREFRLVGAILLGTAQNLARYQLAVRLRIRVTLLDEERFRRTGTLFPDNPEAIWNRSHVALQHASLPFPPSTCTDAT